MGAIFNSGPFAKELMRIIISTGCLLVVGAAIGSVGWRPGATIIDVQRDC